MMLKPKSILPAASLYKFRWKGYVGIKNEKEFPGVRIILAEFKWLVVYVS